jgi:hypothetical protein
MLLKIPNQHLRCWKEVEVNGLLWQLLAASAQAFLTSRPPLNETVLGVFDFAKIIAGGSKN